MITLRRIICCILSGLSLSSCSAVGSPATQRVIQVKVLGDVSLRARNSRWIEEVRGLVESASDYYEREFGVRLVTHRVSPWPLEDRIRATPELLAKLQKDFPKAENHNYDLVIAFTAEGISRYERAGRPRVDRIGNCEKGLGSYVVMPVNRVLHYTGSRNDLELEVIALIHELGHIFGAEHVSDTASIMHEDFGYRTQFDARNRAVIERNKLCPFAK
jgi:Metallo-peptidase family M12